MNIPSAEDVRRRLEPFQKQGLIRLSALSGISLGALQKIRRGAPTGTPNPGIETVRAFWPHIAQAKRG